MTSKPLSYCTKAVNLKAHHTLLIGEDVRVQINHKRAKKADIVIFAPESVKLRIVKEEKEGEE